MPQFSDDKYLNCSVRIILRDTINYEFEMHPISDDLIRDVTEIAFFGLHSLLVYKHVRIPSFSVSKIDYHTILNNPFISQNITPLS